MKTNSKEKSLVHVNKINIFYKIKNFFKSIFHKNYTTTNNISNEKNISNNDKIYDKKSDFITNLRDIEDEQMKLLKLQKLYRNGEIKEENLTQDEINSLCELYDSQISDLSKYYEKEKIKILKYIKSLKKNN